MNKLLSKIGVAIVGMAMAIGVGVAAGISSSNEAKPAQATGEVITITKNSIDVVDEGSDGYAKYNGDHTIGGYTFASSQVMPNGNNIQFQGNAHLFDFLKIL